jgi:hypothetical protein
MAVPLHELPGLRPLAVRMEKADSRLGFLWQADGAIPADVDVLRRQVPTYELAAFDNDLVNLGRVYAAEYIDGTLHHLPLLYFTEPQGSA